MRTLDIRQQYNISAVVHRCRFQEICAQMRISTGTRLPRICDCGIQNMSSILFFSFFSPTDTRLPRICDCGIQNISGIFYIYICGR